MTKPFRQRKWLINTINYSIAILLLTILSGMPFALKSLYASVQSNAASDEATTLILAHPNAKKRNEFVQLELLAKDIDPVGKTIKFVVSGYHDCWQDCGGHVMRLHMSTFYLKKNNDNRVPQSVSFDVPANNGEFEHDIVMPIDGDISIYPFDQYQVDVALSAERVDKGKSTFIGSGSNNLNLSVDEQIPHFVNNQNTIINNVDAITTAHPPTIAFSGNFKRPFYVEYIVCLLVVLLVITTSATILLADFSKLITSAASIILGVWGTRSLLLGSLPADVSVIDIILTLIAIGTLISVAIKSALHVRNKYQHPPENRQ